MPPKLPIELSLNGFSLTKLYMAIGRITGQRANRIKPSKSPPRWKQQFLREHENPSFLSSHPTLHSLISSPSNTLLLGQPRSKVAAET